MIKKYFIIALCLLFLPSLAFGVTVNSGHPRIFITSTNLSALQTRAETTHSDTYGALKTWCETNWSTIAVQKAAVGVDYGFLRYAFIYALGEIDGFSYTSYSISDYGDKAVAILLDLADDGLSDVYMTYAIKSMALAYDWANDKMTSGQKTTMVALFVDWLGDPELSATEIGYRFTRTPLSFYPGLAFYGDGINDSQAQTYVDFIPTFLDDTRASSHMSGHDGGLASGFGYAIDAYGSLLPLAEDYYALMTATTETFASTFTTYPYNNGYPIWVLYGVQPGPTSPERYDDNAVVTMTKFEDISCWQWNIHKSEDDPFYRALKLIAQVFNDNGDTSTAQLVTWFSDTLLECVDETSTYEILFNNRSISPASPTSLETPPVKAFGWDETNGVIDSYMGNPKAGMGQVYMKSSWDQAASTTHAMFAAFPYHYFGHQHFDSLSFSIFKGDSLALPKGSVYVPWYEGGGIDLSVGGVGNPHQWYFSERTVGHNSLLILDPEEVMVDNDYPYGQQIKDGGQRVFHDLGGVWGDVLPGGLRDWGGLIRHEDTDDYTYSSGDATKGYNSVVDEVEYLTYGADAKVTLVQRDFVYLKSNAAGDNDYFVVFDRIDSTDASFKKVFLLHTIAEPEFDGDESTVYGDVNGGLYESTNTDYIKIENGTSSKLFVKTLLPTSTHMYKMGGEWATTTAQTIANDVGITIGGAKIDIDMTSTAGFSAKPTVIIAGTGTYGTSKECFMCEGKSETQLLNCIRGPRVWLGNEPLTISNGAAVTQEFTWMVKEGDADWIGYPYDYGLVTLTNDIVKDIDEYGRWVLRIESTATETHTNFLNVLRPTVDMEETDIVDTTLINAASMSGALIEDSSNQWISMFSKTEVLQDGVTYSASYTGDCKHLISGMEAGVYAIYKDDVKIGTKKASDQNTIYFESTDGGEFQLVQSVFPYVVNDLTFYEVPTVSRPAKGGSYEDPNFFTTITRITDSSIDTTSGRAYSYCQPGYPKHDIENADGTKLLIQCVADSGWAIFDATAPYALDHFISSGTIGWSRSIDCRWDTSDPDILYFTMNYAGNKLYKYDVSTKEFTVIHDFAAEIATYWPELSITEISMFEEGKPSDDMRYWAYIVLAYDVGHIPQWWRTAIIVYDKDFYSENNGKIISVLNEDDPGFYGNGFASMSPSGDYVWTGDLNYIYSRDFSSALVLDLASAHSSIGYSAEGREIVAGIKYNNSTSSYWCAMTDIQTNVTTFLYPLAILGHHVSAIAHDIPGWAIYSSYYPLYPAVEDSWGDHEVYMVELTTRTDPTPKVWRLAHTQGILVAYNDAPFAKFNTDGTKVFFGSSWGSTYNDLGSIYDVYQIDLPADWQTNILLAEEEPGSSTSATIIILN